MLQQKKHFVKNCLLHQLLDGLILVQDQLILNENSFYLFMTA